MYISSLVDVSAISEGYFLHIGPDPIGTAFRGRVFIQDDTGLKFGLSKGVDGAVYTTSTYSTSTTYLLVLKYQIVLGANNDLVSLFVFADGEDFSTEPGTPDVGPLDVGTQSDINPGSIALRQFSSTQNIIVDGIRVSTGWTEAPLPVELSSFSAIILDNIVELNWRTETEVSNYGFEVQCSEFGVQSSEWQALGFVDGHGNSNSPKEYSFTDDKVTGGKYSYRLKQIDTDGKFEYSKVIQVDLGSPGKFELSQNYPNPFNPVTTIRFSLPQSGNVKLTVYNILGEQVAELVNGFKEAGVHTINFNAENLNSGLYIYKIEANGFVQSRKMTLVK
jgi:hypothetical protein